jgi:hypothetical protein
MKKETPKFQITREDLNKMKEIDIRSVDRESLVDINDVQINTDLPDEERMLDFVRQIKNPYCYICNGMVVKTRFVGKQSLEECIKATLFTENDN